MTDIPGFWFYTYLLAGILVIFIIRRTYGPVPWKFWRTAWYFFLMIVFWPLALILFLLYEIILLKYRRRL